MIHLITSFYLAKNNERKNEIIKCLTKNIESKKIEKIHLFLDDNKCKEFVDNLKSDKIQIVYTGKQPLYSDFVEYANTLSGKICMISNSDIWLSEVRNQKLLDLLKNRNLVYSLTRHEYDLKSPLIDLYQGSHDAFIFESPIDGKILKHIKFVQNVWGSENVMLYELKKLSYKLYNPCKQIVIVHEHKSESRDENRTRINRGGLDGDNVYKVRSHCVSPCIITYDNIKK